jgi:Fe-S-cluster containining protein
MKSEKPKQFVQIERRNKLSRDEFNEVMSNLETRIWKNLKTEPVPFKKLSGRCAESFLTPASAPVPDCQTCGACCIAVPWVDVKLSDETSAENCWDITIEAQNGETIVSRQLRRDAETGNCLALRGEAGKTVECAIYEARPDDCRKFEAGSDKCHALRRAYELEPPLNDMETALFMMQIFLRDDPEGDERAVYHTQIQETETAGEFEIEVYFKDQSAMILHRFNADEESWLESEFSAVTLAEAKNLIASRKKIVQNGS